MKTDPIVVQRWRELRGMLIDQLEMFESGRLTLKTADVDVSGGAVSALRREILEFDALILADEAAGSSNVRSDAGATEPSGSVR
jgi:hypothetical protein